MRATELAVVATMDKVGTPTLGGEPLSTKSNKNSQWFLFRKQLFPISKTEFLNKLSPDSKLFA